MAAVDPPVASDLLHQLAEGAMFAPIRSEDDTEAMGRLAMQYMAGHEGETPIVVVEPAFSAALAVSLDALSRFTDVRDDSVIADMRSLIEAGTVPVVMPDNTLRSIRPRFAAALSSN